MDMKDNNKNHSSMLASLPVKALWRLWFLLVSSQIPYFIKGIMLSQYALSMSYLLIVVTSSVYVMPLIRGKAPPISVLMPILTMNFAMTLTIFIYGSDVVVWVYPCIISFYFVLPTKQAGILSGLLVISSSAALAYHHEWIMLVRFVFSTVIVCALIQTITKHVFNLKQELVTLSTTDALTGAFNRRFLDDMLLASINKRHVTTLLLIDIDHFKQVNDVFGHEVGDHVLQALVECMQAHSRQNDTVFRMGGEEFVMLLPNTTLAQAEVYANFLRLELSKIIISDSDKNITVSIGVSELSMHQSTDAWLRQADQCLYRAKSEGRDRVVTHAMAIA